jgi:hypothetical protein
MRGKVAESGKYITGRRLLRIFLPQAGDLIFSGSADVERGGIPDGKRQEGCAKCHKGGEAALEMRAARPYPSHRKMRIINSLQCYFDCLGVGGRQSVAQFLSVLYFIKEIRAKVTSPGMQMPGRHSSMPNVSGKWRLFVRCQK